jgi:hypothetical protein
MPIAVFFLGIGIFNLIIFIFSVLKILLGGFGEAAFRRQLRKFPPVQSVGCKLHDDIPKGSSAGIEYAKRYTAAKEKVKGKFQNADP